MSLILPFGFKDKISYQGRAIQYIGLSEMGQGGPEVGRLYIDGESQFNKHFSGPMILHDNLICIPVLNRSWLSTGFRIGIINLSDLTLKLVGKTEPLILLDKVVDDVIFYFTDINNTKRKEAILIYC